MCSLTICPRGSSTAALIDEPPMSNESVYLRREGMRRVRGTTRGERRRSKARRAPNDYHEYASRPPDSTAYCVLRTSKTSRHRSIAVHVRGGCVVRSTQC